MRMHYLQHVLYETPGNIIQYFNEKSWVVAGTHLYMDESLPKLDDFDLLVVMGGPMGVYDENNYPWLLDEKALIKAAIATGKQVLGICLGAQLIAECLGAKVMPSPVKEIGWFPIEAVGHHKLIKGLFPESEIVFHWHGDTFELPEGAIQLFTSVQGINQGFIYNDQVLALQFHSEMLESSVKALVKHGGDELNEASYVQSATSILETNIYYQRNVSLLYTLLDRFLVV